MRPSIRASYSNFKYSRPLPEFQHCVRLDAAVEDEGDRTVVDELHLHTRAEDAGLDREVRGLAQGLDELLEQALRRRRIGRLIEPGTSPLAGIPQQRELRDRQKPAAKFGERAVHLAGLVAEDAERRDLL